MVYAVRHHQDSTLSTDKLVITETVQVHALAAMKYKLIDQKLLEKACFPSTAFPTQRDSLRNKGELLFMLEKKRFASGHVTCSKPS